MKSLLAFSIIFLNTLLVHSLIPDGVYYIINRGFLQVMEISYWSQYDGASVGLDFISDGDNQKFIVTSVGGYYQIISLDTGKALTAPSVIALNNTQIVQWNNTARDTQLWSIFPTDTSGYYKIQSRFSGEALTGTQSYAYLPPGTYGSYGGNGGTSTQTNPNVNRYPGAQIGVGAQLGTQTPLPSPGWYLLQNQIVQSPLTIGNVYQDFLFIQVAPQPTQYPPGYGPYGSTSGSTSGNTSGNTPRTAASSSSIPSSGSISVASNDASVLDAAETQTLTAALEQEPAQANNGFLGFGEPVDQEGVIISEEAGLQ